VIVVTLAELSTTVSHIEKKFTLDVSVRVTVVDQEAAVAATVLAVLAL
jgi:hypothetical protein